MKAHEFEWNAETKELSEVRRGSELIDQKQQKVEGSFINRTTYPEHTARNLIAELTRQVRDADVQIKAMENTNKQLEKDLKPLDKAFFEKFKTCMARMGIDKNEEGMQNSKEQHADLTRQLAELKEAMGGDF